MALAGAGLVGAAVALVTPGIQSDLIGAGLLLLVYVWQRVASARAQPQQGNPADPNAPKPGDAGGAPQQ